MAVDTTQAARKKMTMARAQKNLYSHNVARQICEVDTRTMGTIYNPYTTLPAVNDGAVSSATYTIADSNVDADSMQVNRRADVSEHVNSYDWKSVGFGLINDRGDNFGKTISQTIDRHVLSNVVGNGGFALGDGGTDGSTTAWTSSNSVIDDIVNSVIEQVEIADGHGERKFMVVSPYEANDLRGFMQNNGFNTADNAIERGIPFVGTTFSGVDIYQTNNLKNEVVLGLATNPTDGDTITINGVTITFKATLGSEAGTVHIASKVDNTRANLADFLNGTTFPGDTDEASGADAGYNALSTADQYKLARLGLTASDSAGDDELTITAKGTLVVSETLTDGTDGWTSVKRYLVGGNYGSAFLALPTQGMDYHEKEVSGKAGVELFMEQFYNTTIWTLKQPLIGTVLVD